MKMMLPVLMFCFIVCGCTAAKNGSTAAPSAVSQNAQIAADLDKVGHKLVAQAARTVVPNKGAKKVRKHGKQYLATYIDIDENKVSTSMNPSTSGQGQYVGYVRYVERTLECRGATKKAALESTDCLELKSRGVSELIHYDGTKWVY